MASLSPSLSTENITNFRDVASTTTNASNQPTLKPNLFYRSALPSTASPSARANLSNIYKIKTILDLRTDTELGEQEKEKKQQLPKNPSTSSLSSLSAASSSSSSSLVSLAGANSDVRVSFFAGPFAVPGVAKPGPDKTGVDFDA